MGCFCTPLVASAHLLLLRLTDYNSRSVEFLVFSSSSISCISFLWRFSCNFVYFACCFCCITSILCLCVLTMTCYSSVITAILPCTLMYVYVSCVSCPSSFSCFVYFHFHNAGTIQSAVLLITKHYWRRSCEFPFWDKSVCIWEMLVGLMLFCQRGETLELCNLYT